METSPDSRRLDVWLWQARFFKTRALAHTHITKRGLRITRHGQTRKIRKPAANVMIGDTLVWVVNDHLFNVTIQELGTRRGPATEAATLYHRNTLDGEENAG